MNAANAIARARSIPDLRTEVVSCAHIMGIECAPAVDGLVLDFLGVAD